MDNSNFASLVIIFFCAVTVIRFRKPFYALLLEKSIFRELFYPLSLYLQFRKEAKLSRNEWAEEIIERHKNARKTDADS
jgi:hypothetical protein